MEVKQKIRVRTHLFKNDAIHNVQKDDAGVLQGREGGQYSTRQIKAVEQSRAG